MLNQKVKNILKAEAFVTVYVDGEILILNFVCNDFWCIRKCYVSSCIEIKINVSCKLLHGCQTITSVKLNIQRHIGRRDEIFA